MATARASGSEARLAANMQFENVHARQVDQFPCACVCGPIVASATSDPVEQRAVGVMCTRLSFLFPYPCVHA